MKYEFAVDALDHEAIQAALSFRHGMAPLPDGEGDFQGRILAEICRGWMEMLGEWPPDSFCESGEPEGGDTP